MWYHKKIKGCKSSHSLTIVKLPVEQIWSVFSVERYFQERNGKELEKLGDLPSDGNYNQGNE